MIDRAAQIGNEAETLVTLQVTRSAAKYAIGRDRPFCFRISRCPPVYCGIRRDIRRLRLETTALQRAISLLASKSLAERGTRLLPSEVGLSGIANRSI
jgi:hypothetical protein